MNLTSSNAPLVTAHAQPHDPVLRGLGDDYLLLVEDNDDDAMLTLRTLKKLGIHTKVVTARDGAEALEVLGGNGQDALPCLVLLDLKLPKVDGGEVLRRLRADPKTSGLPVVVISSSKEEIERLKHKGLGAVDYVVKSYHHDSFARSLEQIKPFCS